MKDASIWHELHVNAAGIAWKGRLVGSSALAGDVGHRVYVDCSWVTSPLSHQPLAPCRLDVLHPGFCTDTQCCTIKTHCCYVALLSQLIWSKPMCITNASVKLGLDLLYIIHQVALFLSSTGFMSQLLHQLLSCKRAVVNAWVPISLLLTSKVLFLPLQNALKVFPDFPPALMNIVKTTDPSTVTQHGLYTRDLSQIHVHAKQPHKEASGTTPHSCMEAVCLRICLSVA